MAKNKNTLATKLVAVVASAKSAVKSVAKKTVKAIENKFADFKQAYRAMKTMDKASYIGQGHGSICNQRTLQMRKMETRASGQFCVLHQGVHGICYSWGKLIEKAKDGSVTIQCGLVQLRFVAKQIIATFDTYAQLVAYVQKKGELNVQGTEKWKTLSNGERYSVYTDGKQALRYEQSGRASGTYKDFQRDGKLYGKFVKQAVK